MKFAITVTSLVLALHAGLSNAAGCSNCGGFPQADIASGCKTSCQTMLQLAAPSAISTCQANCDILVIAGHCCTTTVCSDTGAKLRMHRRDDTPAALEAVFGAFNKEVEGSASNSTATKRSTVEVDDEERRDLAPRDFTQCCNAAKALWRAASYCHNRIGTVASMCALAGAVACTKVYGGVCNPAAH